jgi:hypothetical protein
MPRVRGRIAIAVLLVFAAMQLYQPKQGDARRPKGKAHIENTGPIPARVASVLQRACYDCHSNATDYPLYAYVQPVGWWLEGHITRGREQLDFSAFGGYSRRRQASKMDAIAGQVKSGAMPPQAYSLMHKQARLTPGDVKAIAEWAEALQDSLSK